MAQTAFGAAKATGGTEPKLTFIFNFKRFKDDSLGREGIFGNSDNPIVQSSFRFMGTEDQNLLEAGLQSESNPTGLEDYTVQTKVNTWHCVAMTYDGNRMQGYSNGELLVYVNGVPQTGNAQADRGNDKIRIYFL